MGCIVHGISKSQTWLIDFQWIKWNFIPCINKYMHEIMKLPSQGFSLWCHKHIAKYVELTARTSRRILWRKAGPKDRLVVIPKDIHSFTYWAPTMYLIPFLPCCSTAKSCLTLCDPMVCSMPGFPALHYLLEFAQTHVHWVNDANQPFHPLSPASPPALNLSQYQGLFQWVGSSCQVAKVLEL